jgi:hypothetical protein
MLTAAVFYGLLRKSQIFGEPDRNVAVNAIVALVAGFMVWSYPIIAGIDVTLQLANFFMEGLVVSLVIMMGLLIAGFVFPPDLPKTLGEKFKGGPFWIAILVLGFILGGVVLVSSGLFGLFFPTQLLGGGGIDQDTLLTVGILIILLVSIIVIVGVGGGKGSPAPSSGGEKK